MSTRAYIAREIKKGTGQYEFVLNHSNGAPEDLGRILKRNFNCKASVDTLLAGGEIEYIHPFTGKIVRGEAAGTSSVVPDYQLYNMRHIHYIDYLYIYKRGNWVAVDLYDQDVAIP